MEKFNCPSCKYEFEKKFATRNSEEKIIKGDEEPIRLFLSNSIQVIKHATMDYYSNEQKVRLIACPKCKTVIIED